VVRKVTFTGSVAVGKQLARLASNNLQRCTLELGGHSPAIVFADADVDAAVEATGSFKFRNAGQVCIAPNRFFIHNDVYDQFVEKFSYRSDRLIVGDGMDAHVQMGPMANARRMDVMRRFVDDASRMGARIVTGGERIGNRGYFWKPTVLADVPDSAAVMTEEPFGPIAPMTSFREIEEVITRANALRYGLAAYVFTRSPRIAEILSDRLETGSVGINHLSPMPVDAPMGGVKESGYGYEGGLEGLEAFLQLKLITSAWS
jgi:succinate-semialdehyde dehydrogenase/glutarate-semialdehyde dehydrogenase